MARKGQHATTVGRSILQNEGFRSSIQHEAVLVTGRNSGDAPAVPLRDIASRQTEAGDTPGASVLDSQDMVSDGSSGRKRSRVTEQPLRKKKNKTSEVTPSSSRREGKRRKDYVQQSEAFRSVGNSPGGHPFRQFVHQQLWGQDSDVLDTNGMSHYADTAHQALEQWPLSSGTE